jgi:hypothetical protein
MSDERTICNAAAAGPLVAWRTRRLVEAGLSAQLAERIAADCAYDLHALLELIDRGAPAPLAVRILAPLDEHSKPC